MTKRRLKLEGPMEDIPRLIVAKGNACGGKFTFVMVPHRGSGILALFLKPPRQKRGEPKVVPKAMVWAVDADVTGPTTSDLPRMPGREHTAKDAAKAPIASLESHQDDVGATSVLTGLYAFIGLESAALDLVDAKIVEHPEDKGYVAIRNGLEQRAFPKP